MPLSQYLMHQQTGIISKETQDNKKHDDQFDLVDIYRTLQSITI